MPFMFVGLHLLPDKFDKIKLHDVSYENTTGSNLKNLILSDISKKKDVASSSGEVECKEKKFKAENPCEDKASVTFVTNGYDDISPQEMDLVYCGKVINDETPVSSYNVKDYTMVHVFAKGRFVLGKSKEKSPTVVPETEKSQDWNNTTLTYVNSLHFQFQRLTASPSFGKSVLKKLKKPENMKKILTAHPALKNDPVALAIIKEPELLLQINNIETVTKIAKNHPALARCVTDLVDILFEEIYNSITPPVASPAGHGSSQHSISSPYLSGEEDMELNPTASGESSARITAEQVAAALQSASSSVPQSPAITPEYVNSTMMQIMSNLSTPGTATSSTPSTSATTPDVTAAPVNPLEQYASQIQQMRELGVTDEVAMVEALQLTNGDVQAALNLVFGL